MRRTSFAGALLVIAIGAVLAFAVQGSPRDLDLQTAGVILIIGGAADLVIRSLIADSPLLSRQSADVAAVVEPVGEPVLDAAGNPIAVANAAAVAHLRPPLVAPLPGTMPPGAAAETIVVTDEYGVEHVSSAGAGAAGAQPAGYGADAAAAYGQYGQHGQGYAPEYAPEYPPEQNPEYSRYTEAVRAATGDPLDTPESPVAVTTLGGRPVRPRGRGFGRGRRRGRG